MAHDRVMKDLRRIVSAVVIGSFSVAALLGIAALLGGSFGDTQARVLLTTVVIGLESIAVLCYLSTAGRPFAAVGLLGFLVSLVPFLLGLGIIWLDDTSDSESIARAIGVGATLAASLAQACLLLALTWSARHRAALLATLVAVTVVALMIALAIIDGEDLDDGYWRTFGVVAILDVLGTVILIALGVFGRSERRVPAVALSPAVLGRVSDVAARRGTTPDAVVDEALDQLEQP